MTSPTNHAEQQARTTHARLLASALAILLWAIAIVFSAELHTKAGFILFTEQGLAAILGLSLALIFLTGPGEIGAKRRETHLYDIVLALLGLSAGLYLSFRYPTIAEDFFAHHTEAFAVGLILVPLVIEALRRTAGMGLVWIVLVFVAYGLFGHLVPGQLQGRSKSLFDLLAYLGIDNVAMFGLPMTIVCTVVVMFIFMGQLLLKTGASEWFTEIATALMGRSRGGAAKVSILASALFGTISGSAVANVASTGVITIPLMKQAGYEPRVAGAFEAVASTGGQIMPPIMGAAAFLMAEFLQVSYSEVVLAAIVPAFLYYVAILLQADMEAARKNLAPVPDELIPQLGKVLKEGWYFVLPFILLIYALFELHLTPEEAALWAAGSIILLNWIFGYKGRRLSLADLFNAVRDTGLAAPGIVVLGAMAGIVIGVLEVTGLGFALTFILVQLGEGNLLALLALTAIICIVLGMGMPTTAIYILVATLAAPPLIKLGVDPMAAHMFVFYFGVVSLITPPVAVAAFVAASLAEAKPLDTALTAVRLGWTALVVPFLFVYAPSLILKGTPFDVGLAVVTAIAGVWLTTAGIMGHFKGPLGIPMRLAFAVAGLALLVPATAFKGAIYLEIFGLICGTIVVGLELMRSGKPVHQ